MHDIAPNARRRVKAQRLKMPFCISPVEGKGMGAIATRDIAVGERVLAEPPLFTLSCQSGPKAEAAADAAATAAVQALSISGRKAFDALHQSHVHGSERTPLRTFRSNSLPLGGTSSATEAGLFPVAARFNHSCRPNVRHQWNTALGCQTLHACRAVKKGEELLTSYIDLERTRAQRQQALSTRFGFDCACEACSLSGEALAASDARRAELGQLVGAVFHAVRARKFEQAVALSERQLQLLQQEGLDSPGLMERATFDAFQAARHAGQQEQALQWLRQVREHCALAMGRDAPGVKMYDEMLADEERRAATSTAVST